LGVLWWAPSEDKSLFTEVYQMKTSIQEKKQKALELLKQLDICEDYVEIFKEKDMKIYSSSPSLH